MDSVGKGGIGINDRFFWNKSACKKHFIQEISFGRSSEQTYMDRGFYRLLPTCLSDRIHRVFPAILELQGMDPSTAGFIASMITWLMIPGSLIMPNASDRLGLRKPFFWISSIIAGVALYFAGTMIGPTLWISIIIYGFLSGGMAALALAMPIELAGPSYAATAGGLSLVIGYLGAMIGPWLAGYLSTVTGSFVLSTIVCVLLTEANVIAGLILKETGKKASRKNT